MARPKANPRLKQGTKLTTYMTEAEYEALKVLCNRMGFTASQFMRKAMLDKLHSMNELIKDKEVK